MISRELALYFLTLLAFAVLVEPLARRLLLPFGALLVALGFVFGTVVIPLLSIDTGIRWYNYYPLVFYGLLPVLVFSAAFSIRLSQVRRDLLLILMLAIPLMLVSTLITAGLVYFGVGYESGFPWVAALITGALLSATDPSAAVEMFRRCGAPQRLCLLLEGESLSSDATAVVLFGVFTTMAAGMVERQGMDLPDVSLWFLKLLLGGGVVGALLGVLAALVIKKTAGHAAGAVITVVSAYGGFLIADVSLHASGVIAVLVTGLLLGRASRRHEQSNPLLARLWQYQDYVANIVVFLLCGITIQLAMFNEQWLAMGIGISAVLIARALTIFVLLPAMSRIARISTLTMADRRLLYLGGVRGAIAVALALSLPPSLPYWWTIQSIVYGVVIFDLFVQGPVMALTVNK